MSISTETRPFFGKRCVIATKAKTDTIATDSKSGDTDAELISALQAEKQSKDKTSEVEDKDSSSTTSKIEKIAVAPESKSKDAIALSVVEAKESIAVIEEADKKAAAVEVEEAKVPQIAVKVETKETAKPSAKENKPLSKPVVVTTASATLPKVAEIEKADQIIESRKPIRDKWALIVGITDFQNPDIPDLKYSAKDATDFYNYLIKEGNFSPDHVRILLNEKATQRRVLSELGSKFLARVVKPDDLVVLYFSTHGSPSQLDPRGRNYLVAHDSDPSDLFATGLEMQKLLDSIQGRVLTDRVLLVLDACHSGFADPDSKGIARTANFNVNELVQGSGQLVICSSAPDQRAWESTRYKNGVFTKRFLEGLRSNGANTKLQEAFTFTEKAVGNEVQEDRPGAVQTPALKGKWTGRDLIVSVPPAAPQEVPASVVSDLGPDSRVDLVASRPVTDSAKGLGDSNESSTPKKKVAPKHGVIYLDSQFFKLKGDARHLVREYHDAIRSNPSDSSYYYLKAKALIQLEDWHNALLCLNDALQLSPNRAHYYLGRAYVFYKQGKRVLAQQDLNQAQSYDPRFENICLPD